MMVYQRAESSSGQQIRKYGGTGRRCRNCGFGLGQFGVEIRDEYCSLDCFTSAKVTGRLCAGDAKCGPRYNREGPWPRGLLVEAPPSPKPWRGRTKSSGNLSSPGASNLIGDALYQESNYLRWHSSGNIEATRTEQSREHNRGLQLQTNGTCKGGGHAGGDRALGNGINGGGNATGMDTGESKRREGLSRRSGHVDKGLDRERASAAHLFNGISKPTRAAAMNGFAEGNGHVPHRVPVSEGSSRPQLSQARADANVRANGGLHRSGNVTGALDPKVAPGLKSGKGKNLSVTFSFDDGVEGRMSREGASDRTTGRDGAGQAAASSPTVDSIRTAEVASGGEDIQATIPEANAPQQVSNIQGEAEEPGHTLCPTVRANPTRQVLRQWRHLFFL